MANAVNITTTSQASQLLRDKLASAEHEARDQQYNIGHAAALLTTMAREAGGKCVGTKKADSRSMEARWLCVEYLASQIERHVAELGAGLDKVDGALNHMERSQ